MEVGQEDAAEESPPQRRSMRDKLRQGAAVKSFIAQTLDKGLRAMHDLKEQAATHLDAAAGNVKLFSERRKQRKSEDLTLQAVGAEQQLVNSDEEAKEAFVRKQLDFEAEQSPEMPREDLVGPESDEEDSELSENAQRKLLEDELLKEDDDEDEDSNGSDSEGELSNVPKEESDLSDDIANRSLNADDENSLVVIEKENYLRYVSDKYNVQTDVLEVVDRNERSFKQVAERMISKTSYLIQPAADGALGALNTNTASHGAPTARRLMHLKMLTHVSEKYHGDPRAPQGIPYSVAALEQYIAVGSSDGATRLFSFFDNAERELKTLCEKALKNVAVMHLDMKRSRNGNVFVVTGHSKGQLCLYELKGLRPYHEVSPAQVGSKLHKIVSDVHS